MKAEERKDYFKTIRIKRFTPEEDQIIRSLASTNEENDWFEISKSLKDRTPRQCRDRWTNYLNPTLNKNEWKNEDDELLLKLYNEKGSQWKLFCEIFNGRGINDVRNRCFKLIRRKKKSSKNIPQDKKMDDEKDEIKPIPMDDDAFDIKRNIFDNDIFSNFDSLQFDINDLYLEFEF